MITPKPRKLGGTDRKYIYTRADVERLIATASDQFGPNRATNPLGYLGGGIQQTQMFAFVEHRQPFFKGRFRKVGFTT